MAEHEDWCPHGLPTTRVCGYCDTLAEVERLKAENESMQRELERSEGAVDSLQLNGFVRCDSPACNCGRWHERYGYPERFRELEDVLEPRNGETLLSAAKRVLAENAKLRAAGEALEKVVAYHADQRGFGAYQDQLAAWRAAAGEASDA